MRSVTEEIEARISPDDVRFWLQLGNLRDRDHEDWQLRKDALGWARDAFAVVRACHDLKAVSTPILTAPAANMKLAKGETPAYGITLQHYVVRMSTGLVVNACPSAGDCVKMCVLNSGNGAYPKVQRARRAKLEFAVLHPWAFFLLLGNEIRKAIDKHDVINVRPNVNSDIEWERAAPALVDGSIFGDAAMFYGYTKHASVLDTDGWLTPFYRVAYSWNESSDGVDVARFLDAGGSVAMVTDRKKGQPVRELMVRTLDADLTDEWIFESSVIGDLTAKGKAQRFVGKSAFIVERGVR